MTKIIMHGCNGKMGQVIAGIVREDSEVEIVAGIDLSNHIKNEFPVFNTIEECDVNADVIIDFAVTQAVNPLLKYAKKKHIPVVLCTTGLTEEQLRRVSETSKEVAILKSANMSYGVNLLLKQLKEIAPKLAGAGFRSEERRVGKEC